MKNLILLSIFTFVFIISSCKKDDNIVNNPVTVIQKIKLTEGYSEGTKIELYADDTLRTGYNKLYIRFLDSTSLTVVHDAHLTITPVMDMGSVQHSCPTEQTDSVQIIGELFPAAAIFTMAGSDIHKWSITITFHNHVSNKEG